MTHSPTIDGERERETGFESGDTLIIHIIHLSPSVISSSSLYNPC